AVLTATAMATGESLPDQVRHDARLIQRNLELESRLIDDLLDVTRIAHGKLELHRQSLDLHEVVRDALNMCRAHADAKGVKLVHELRASQSFLDGDPAKLQQVFTNLLTNAVKFT